MAYRSDVHLLCTPKLGSEIADVAALAPESCKPRVKANNIASYFIWEDVVWDKYICDWCSQVYRILDKYKNDPKQGYKLICMGDMITDIEEIMNEAGRVLFDSLFYPIRSIQLPNNLF